MTLPKQSAHRTTPVGLHGASGGPPAPGLLPAQALLLCFLVLVNSCSVEPTVDEGASLQHSPDADKASARQANSADRYMSLCLDRELSGAATFNEAVAMLAGLDGSDPPHFKAGNDVQLKVDGPDTFKAMFEDIDQAQHHIHLETYILEDDEIGKGLAERLIASKRRGVEVRLQVDAFGSMTLPDEFLERLESQGIEVQKFHPIDPSEDPRVWRTNNRDHRKVLVVDGRVAYTGGINFSSVYSLGSQGFRVRKPDSDVAWRDTHVRLAGPVVAEFQQRFLEMWNTDISREEQVGGDRYFPELEGQGEIAVAVVADKGGDSEEFKIYSALATATGNARSRAWITQAYFAPNAEFLEILQAAAERGVDVRLLLPGLSDAPLVVQASRSSYEALLEAGVRIYEREASVLHAKTIVVDGVWSSIGSANLDYRSLVHNFELNAVVVSCSFGGEMEAMFEKDLRGATEVTLQQWQQRPLHQRFKEWLGGALREWL